MSKRLYKYQLWNSSWYKKNISDARATWEETIVTGSGEVIDQQNISKTKKRVGYDFFPWWRLER